MTFTDCTVTLEGLTHNEDVANPKVFQGRLPPTRTGQYWAPTIERFAKENGITIKWVLDNSTPEIVVTGEQLKVILRDAYGSDSAFFRSTLVQLSSEIRFRVYADDF
jgi:hypothetical protein